MVAGIATGEVADYQWSALLMAILWRGMTADETAALTDAMMHSGSVVDLSATPGLKVDKHSTGGVGDKTSLILAPIAAAAGVPVPMVSGRGLGHTGGTLDKLESIPGFRVDVDLDRYKAILDECGLVLIGQTAEIAPADKMLYALSDATATVESIPLDLGLDHVEEAGRGDRRPRARRQDGRRRVHASGSTTPGAWRRRCARSAGGSASGCVP